MDAKNIWKEALPILKSQIDEIEFKSFIATAIPVECKGGIFHLKISNNFAQTIIEEKYRLFIEGVLSGITGSIIKLKLSKGETEEFLKKINKRKFIRKKSNLVSMPLNPNYTFNNFVVGKSNEFAYTVSQTVAKSPGKVYNPLFLYGGVGLGKTHLLQAIGNYVYERKSNFNIAYVSAEAFMNELVKSFAEKTTSKFREKYRKIDLLLMDDIQWLAGKDAIQEEFFHTFNELFQRNKQIVVTSDRPPKKIKKLQDRLINRFTHGLIADIQLPDLELRIAFLNKKALDNDVSLPQDVVYYVAERIHSSMRELEGAFTRLMAFSSLNNVPISIELAEEILGGIVEEKKKQINIEYIQRLVAEEYDLKVADLQSKKRSSNISQARQIAMYLARKYLDVPLKLIGEKFGGRDHTTVIHSVSKVEKLIERNLEFRNEIEKLESRLSL